MKITKKCPICKDNLLNIPYSGKNDNLWKKTCSKKTDHSLTYFYDIKSELIINLILNNRKDVACIFLPLSDTIELYKNETYIKNIKYFEPDFSNILNLFKKVQIYTLLS